MKYLLRANINVIIRPKFRLCESTLLLPNKWSRHSKPRCALARYHWR